MLFLTFLDCCSTGVPLTLHFSLKQKGSAKLHKFHREVYDRPDGTPHSAARDRTKPDHPSSGHRKSNSPPKTHTLAKTIPPPFFLQFPEVRECNRSVKGGAPDEHRQTSDSTNRKGRTTVAPQHRGKSGLTGLHDSLAKERGSGACTSTRAAG